MNIGPAKSRLRALIVLASVGVISIAGVTMLPSAHATQSVTVARFGGADRYQTAQLVAEHGFPAGATTALLARGEDFADGSKGFADALSATYVAGYFKAPLLLTQYDTVPQATLQALRDLKVKNVGILGGTNAISQNVADQLSATASTNAAGGDLAVVRQGGADRYQTSQILAEIPPATYVGTVGGQREALIARGDDFPDALAGGPLADASSLPMILTNPNSLSASASKALQDLNIQHAVILGGAAAISTLTEGQIQALGISTERLAGSDRQQTATVVADYAISKLGFKQTTVDLARGDDYPDSLAGGPEAANIDAVPILLTGSPTNLSTETRTWIRNHDATLGEIDVLGQTGAVSAAVASDASGTATCATTTSTTAATTTTAGSGLGGLLGGGSGTTTTASTGTTLPPCTPPSSTLPGVSSTTTSSVTGSSSTTTPSSTTSTTSTTSAPPTTICLVPPVCA